MKIPKKIKIGGIIYSVELTPKPCKSNLEVDGEIRYSDQIISIRDGVNSGIEYQEYVLIHEILHGIYNHIGIEQDETTIDKLAKGLHMVIKDNPNVFSVEVEEL